MPEISRFFGIIIQMFWNEHLAPHFHALYGELEAIVDIHTLAVSHGSLPRRAMALTLEWAAMHREELLRNWKLFATRQTPRKIPPLE
jgi:hypothetical protein